MEELAAWTARLLDELEMPSAHIVAHSMGCQVALALAHRHPTRVGSLLLGGPTMGKQLIPPWRYLVGLLRASGEPMAYKLMALRMFAQMGVRRYVRTIEAILENDPLPGIGAVTAPALVVHGERDAIIPRAAAHELAGRLPRGAFLSVTGAGHVLQFSHAEAFTQIVIAFLGGTAAQERSPVSVLPASVAPILA
jgi:pimeloyl-ACP methyl ester carboxylesterase